MADRREIAEAIVETVQENEDITKNKLIQEVMRKEGVGSSTVRDILSRLYALEIVGYKVIQRAHAHYVNESKLGNLDRIQDC